MWCLGCSLVGTHLAASWGRKSTALLSQTLLVICLFVIGGLSKIYADDPDGASKSLVYGDVAVMFLFQGFYSIAWTPLLYLYPPEVMNYSIRANGVAFSQLGLTAFAYVAFSMANSDMLIFVSCVLVFVMPIGLENIGWKMYMINGSWDIVIIILIVSIPIVEREFVLNLRRPYTGSRQKGNRSRKSTPFLRVRNTRRYQMWKLCGEGRPRSILKRWRMK